MFKSVKKQLNMVARQLKLNPPHSNDSPITDQDKETLRVIRAETEKLNQNNVTRTQAYFDFFQKHNEIHWALLAHLVSRNAGWNMTDLKGEYLPMLLNQTEQNNFFCFLERGNWLIFQDAYPQLLLYEKSKETNQPLFHLLPELKVSSFMRPFWENFRLHGNSLELTIALIINEQQYIEKRVIQNKLYKETVLDTILFKLQDLFDFNHILFPYTTPLQKKTKVVGGTVHHFSSLEDRINLGKGLYDLLFSVKTRLAQTIDWADMNPHTGSRKDFWPHLFNDVKETAPGSVHELHNSPCSLQVKSLRIYSPSLTLVWKDWIHEKAEAGDWYKNKKAHNWIKKSYNELNGDIQETYCHMIEQLEMAAYTKHLLFNKN
ncbi:DUF2515 domain-containing protein [Halobacillus sp. A1]|uniref:DUF2515 domain-containing protein n=1 Tax=Halobacillus sp. A1 TaxID=2880262 RepID=UPI0020A67F41|nr:DUF2515 domain-containing protein [Halobacillus sp. A1]MCP3031884.1 DUF2515 domain-containing protein [Halobacillus sp. A1]